MQPRPLSSKAVEDSTAFYTLSSSLHTLSLASLRELLLSCALENEQVAAHINAKLHSQNGIKATCNLENFQFHSSGISGEHTFDGDVSPTSVSPRSPDINGGNKQPNSTTTNVITYNDTLTIGNGPMGYQNMEVLLNSPNLSLGKASIPTWNWSYYYYKESSSGATAKREDVDEAAAEVQSRAFYWNEEFQAISDKIRDVDLYDEEHVYVSMAHLYQDFAQVVKTYGKIIIAERFLPFAEKSIPPAFYMGGHAGGEKYIVQGILFKFSVDKDNLYSGDHYAAKAAGHDLKSLIQVYKSRTKGLHVPMMCLVDYLGYRLIAMSMVPIDVSTLCYGSCDGGMDVRCDIPEFNDKMLHLGTALNLKVHSVGSAGKEIVGPCDIEGHKGRDNRFYLIDFARLFPPEAPILVAKRKNSHLYRLLRPELVKRFNVPLSSDAFTLFGKRGAGVHNKEVRQATEHLLYTIIPRFAGMLDSQENPEERQKHHIKYHNLKITDDKLAEILHREGINLRHLGKVRAKVNSRRWRDALLCEILARVIKNVIREKLRERMEQLRHPGVVQYRQTILDYMNIIFGNSSTSLAYWYSTFAEKIENFFEDALFHEKNENIVNWKDHVDLIALFTSVRRLTGMIFSPHCISGGLKFFNSQVPFQDTDLLAFPPKVKEMRIAAYASATALYLKAKYNTDQVESERLASMASVQFEAALRSNPDDDMILCCYALLLRLQKRYDEAASYYKMAIQSNPLNARIKGHYAWFLYRDLRKYDKAEKYYLKTLEIDPSHSRTLSDYATFLWQVRKDELRAEEYFKKGVEFGDKQATSGYASFLAQVGRHEEAKHYGKLLKSANGALILTYEKPPPFDLDPPNGALP